LEISCCVSYEGEISTLSLTNFDGTNTPNSLNAVWGQVHCGYTFSYPTKQQITTVIPTFQGKPVVIVQDAMHAAKTARNNIMTGAKCLTLGGYICQGHSAPRCLQ
jgi:hypothetical protein